MTNAVVGYVPSEGHEELGSFIDDRKSFTIYGTHHDSEVNKASAALILKLNKEYSHYSAVSVSRKMEAERVLGRLSLGGVAFPVNVRQEGAVLIAFHCQHEGTCYETVLLGVAKHPPEHGEQNWWRERISVRLKDWLGV